MSILGRPDGPAIPNARMRASDSIRVILDDDGASALDAAGLSAADVRVHYTYTIEGGSAGTGTLASPTRGASRDGAASAAPHSLAPILGDVNATAFGLEAGVPMSTVSVKFYATAPGLCKSEEIDVNVVINGMWTASAA